MENNSNNINPRSWERKQDVEEILSIIALEFLKPNLEINSSSLFIWYMIKKGKIKDITKYNIHPEIKATLDKMDNMVETIKAFSNLDINSGDKKHTHIMNIISIIRDDFMNISLRFLENPNIFIGFMYGYYLKAGIITAMDVIGLENGYASINGAASYAMVIAATLKAIDFNACLDRSKYKLEPIIVAEQKPQIEPPKEKVKVSENKLEELTDNKTSKVNAKNPNSSKEKEYKNRFITIRGGTGRRPDKPNVKLDMVEVYNYYNEGFSTDDISELYDISSYTLRRKYNNFCKDNGLEPVFNVGGQNKPSTPISKPNTAKSTKSEDELMFEKATLANTQTINKLKNKTFPTIAVIEAPNKQFQNFPVKFSSKSKDKKLIIDDKLKSTIEKNGSGFYKLNDGMYYYITSGDYLIFRNEPTPETLEKYRSIKTY